MFYLRFTALIALVVLILSVGGGFNIFHQEDSFDSEASLVLDFEPLQIDYIKAALSPKEITLVRSIPRREIPSSFIRSAQLLRSFNISLPPPSLGLAVIKS